MVRQIFSDDQKIIFMIDLFSGQTGWDGDRVVCFIFLSQFDKSSFNGINKQESAM